MQAGAGRLDQGASQLHAGTGRLTAGFATLGEKLNSRDPNSPGVALGTQALAAGASELATGNTKLGLGIDKVLVFGSASIYVVLWNRRRLQSAE
ncbi:hypothetical protein [Pseudarthrobacter sp. NBSH8]|uniref:hypothetical protein n=1 Tax=Pseudarthrobacter sp. NBSH8 TaxID=2596911 RepID=UPI00210700DA|nr:hypothetical protein [Pseudarthrobacter sp. NBSH8]